MLAGETDLVRVVHVAVAAVFKQQPGKLEHNHKQLVYKPLIACSCVFKNTGARGEPGHTRDGHTDHTDEPRNQADSQVTTNTAKTPQPIRIQVPVHYVYMYLSMVPVFVCVCAFVCRNGCEGWL